ncbi:MAG: pyridoxal phosphate-dependent aminotransferase [bacterium]|nr:pyridoxal phosphate-dependent aminotransferase [bacterium]
MTVSTSIRESIEKSSFIRKMFEEGARLKAQFGAENVFDFSLGNPDMSPPDQFFEQLKKLADSNEKGIHGYMSNAGYPDVRESIARKVSQEEGVTVGAENIIMTCGAAGGLNTIFKTILNPGDQVIVTKPYFVEYGFYVSNHNGEIVLVDTKEDFSLDIDAIKNAITNKTKAVLINSPNNPTGRIYPEESIQALADLLSGYNTDDRTIFIVSDEPYKDIVYDNTEVPSILKLYSQSMTVTSYSKSLSIPGERIGYIAVNPRCDNIEILTAGLILSNRILGFVNAPALMQRIVGNLNDVSVDVEAYEKRRDLFVEGLRAAGYDLIKPEGAFYLFCKAPGGDDIKFVQHLQEYNILAVPGTGFGTPGYFRLAYCVSEDTIKRSLEKFKEAIQ